MSSVPVPSARARAWYPDPMPDYVSLQGLAAVGAEGGLVTVPSVEQCGGSAADIVGRLAALHGDGPVVGAFEYQTVRYLFGTGEGVAHLCTLETEPRLPAGFGDEPTALPWRFVREHRDLLAAAFGELGEELLEDELADEPFATVPSPDGPHALQFFGAFGWGRVEDMEALARVVSAAAVDGLSISLVAYAGVDAGVLVVQGTEVQRMKLVPSSSEAWARIAELSGATNATKLFATLVTDHAASVD